MINIENKLCHYLFRIAKDLSHESKVLITHGDHIAEHVLAAKRVLEQLFAQVWREQIAKLISKRKYIQVIGVCKNFNPNSTWVFEKKIIQARWVSWERTDFIFVQVLNAYHFDSAYNLLSIMTTSLLEVSWETSHQK